jgi:nanoRNase/pAp phosphatase (c-di-AMP/oligoRNAs hydrolase)
MGRVNELIEFLEGQMSLDIVCHDHPDPDCIASAATLEWIAEESGVSLVRILYGGKISHQQNREMVQQFGLELVPLTSANSISAELVAFVDHAVPGRHTQLPSGTRVDIVIDHHLYNERIRADFVDIRPNYGATSTILVEYLAAITYPPPSDLASMLLFALHRERLDHIRNPTHHEYEAALRLQTHASQSMINHLYSAQFSPAAINTIGKAIRNRVVRGSSLVSWVGHVEERDALSQAANYLINLRGIDNDLILGISDGELHLSARSQNPDLPLDQVIREVVGGDGRAGGHEDMAGGVIPVEPSLAQGTDESNLDEELARPLAERYFESVALADLSHPVDSDWEE